MKHYTVNNLEPFLDDNDEVYGDLNQVITNIADTSHINESSLDWVHNKNTHAWEYLQRSKAKVIIAPTTLLSRTEDIPKDKTVIFTANPMLLFSRIARGLFIDKIQPAIHQTAVIHPKAKIGINSYIGPFCYIGNSRLGDNCIIQSHVSIDDNVFIGNDVLIKSGARIGQTGFGFVKNERCELEKFPQIGSVIVQDKVEIGANTCIDRGALSVTMIGQGTKIDNLVHVAHNVQIGKNCIIVCNASLGGSCIIGDEVWIGLNAAIKEGVKIGRGAYISMGAIVIRNVAQCEDVIGNPAEKKDTFVGKRVELTKLYIKGVRNE